MGAVLCVLALTPAISRAQGANRVSAPDVPAEIVVPEGHVPFLVAHAFGTQGYVCLGSGTSSVWVPFGPQATLFDAELKQVMTHFLSPNPDQGGAFRATWQDSRDTSAIWAGSAIPSTDGNYVAPGAIPWLRLTVVGQEAGPGGGERLTSATYIHRVNTVGGIAPNPQCSDVEKRALVPYEADYYFYRPAGRP